MKAHYTQEEKYMRLAVREAKRALSAGDVPIGCVIVYDGRSPESRADRYMTEQGILPGTVIGRGYNRRNRDRNALMHAEILAIRRACRRIGDWRLEDCTMYVTLEPCPMCAGAIVQARIPRVVFGVRNPKAGCCGSVLDIVRTQGLNHQAEITEGLLQESCTALLEDFFQDLRVRRKAERMKKKETEKKGGCPLPENEEGFEKNIQNGEG